MTRFFLPRTYNMIQDMSSASEHSMPYSRLRGDLATPSGLSHADDLLLTLVGEPCEPRNSLQHKHNVLVSLRWYIVVRQSPIVL